MQDINRIIEERRFLTFEEAAEGCQPLTLAEPEQDDGPIGVEVYSPPKTGLIPILIYKDGSHVIPNEGPNQSYAKEFSSEYELRVWIINYHPTVKWFVDDKGIRRCPITGAKI
jgi:hypothetical protein